MERFQRIIRHVRYETAYRTIQEAEQSREFCLHNMNHFLDVARLSYIFALEEKVDISRDVVYAIGLLHDIGRSKEYTDGTPHEDASVDIAKKILPDCGYSTEETDTILQVIEDHRKKEAFLHSFSSLFYRADKMSRNCQECKAYERCYWSEEKKNHEYKY